MCIKPSLGIGLAVYMGHAAWVFDAWKYRGIDYQTIDSQAGLLMGVVQPLGVAAACRRPSLRPPEDIT